METKRWRTEATLKKKNNDQQKVQTKFKARQPTTQLKLLQVAQHPETPIQHTTSNSSLTKSHL